jgi:hypothetical protein
LYRKYAINRTTAVTCDPTPTSQNSHDRSMRLTIQPKFWPKNPVM